MVVRRDHPAQVRTAARKRAPVNSVAVVAGALMEVLPRRVQSQPEMQARTVATEQPEPDTVLAAQLLVSRAVLVRMVVAVAADMEIPHQRHLLPVAQAAQTPHLTHRMAAVVVAAAAAREPPQTIGGVMAARAVATAAAARAVATAT